jgi:hypothetical protein
VVENAYFRIQVLLNARVTDVNVARSLNHEGTKSTKITKIS